MLRPPWSNAITQWNVCRDSTGTSSSPRPVPSAVPPCSRNGTSLPTVAATVASSSRPISSFHSVASPTRAAAASALPPAMPPATGMVLRINTFTRFAARSRPTWSASATTARQARLSVLSTPAGTEAAPSPVTSTPGSSVAATTTSSVSDSAWNTVVRS